MGFICWGLSINLSIVLAQEIPDKKLGQVSCVPLASWAIPGKGAASNPEVIARAAEKSIVLLGEMHISEVHHRWQLQTIAALYAIRSNMVIGFEMFPRRVQPILDQWIAGKFSEQEFLKAVEWDKVWNTDAKLYLPLFHFARMNRIPMRALNIETHLRQLVSEKGFAGVPVEEREGVTRPAEPSNAYLDYLLPIYKQHDRKDKKKGEVSLSDPDFRRFIASQQLWDRAMAQILYAAALDEPKTALSPLVVGIMGTGHIVHGYGVPHQLSDLGTEDVASLLPWDTNLSCNRFVPGVADAVFGVLPHVSKSFQPQYQRLGIRFEIAHGGAHILQVEKGSVAAGAKLKDTDVIIEMAGVAIKDTKDVIGIVRRHAPGTWLPLKVKRNEALIEIIAKFPVLVD